MRPFRGSLQLVLHMPVASVRGEMATNDILLFWAALENLMTKLFQPLLICCPLEKRKEKSFVQTHMAWGPNSNRIYQA